MKKIKKAVQRMDDLMVPTPRGLFPDDNGIGVFA